MSLQPYQGPARILVGFDGSEDSYRGLEYAIVEAKSRDAELVVVHAVDDTVLNSAWGVVFDPEEIKLNAAEMVARGVEDAVTAGLPRNRVRTEVVLGNPAAALTKMSHHASLVVVGRRASDPAERVFVGSTSVGVVGAAHSPVIVVGSEDIVHEAPLGVIGVAVDTSARGAVALEWALQECGRKGGRVVVESIIRSPQNRWFSSGPTPEQQEEATRITTARMEEMVGEITEDYPDVEVAVEVAHGNPLDVLVARSAELDLLMLEVHASFPTYSVGGLIRGVLTHSQCPVGVIRPRDAHGS